VFLTNDGGRQRSVHAREHRRVLRGQGGVAPAGQCVLGWVSLRMQVLVEAFVCNRWLRVLGISVSGQGGRAHAAEVVPGLVEVEVAVPRLRPAVW
jgi:hypothetical protein